MTDATLAAGDVSLAENISTPLNLIADALLDVGAEHLTALPDAAEPQLEVPNGFLTLGLAPELIAAVKDLGFSKPPVTTTLAPRHGLVYRPGAGSGTVAGCQRVGSNSLMRLLGCVGKRVSTSVRYASGSIPLIFAV